MPAFSKTFTYAPLVALLATKAWSTPIKAGDSTIATRQTEGSRPQLSYHLHNNQLDLLGCYVDGGMPDQRDSNNRTIPMPSTGNKPYAADTPEACAALAVNNHAKYVGLQYGGECYFGDTFIYNNTDARMSDDDCTSPSIGNSSLAFGGFWRVAVYQNKQPMQDFWPDYSASSTADSSSAMSSSSAVSSSSSGSAIASTTPSVANAAASSSGSASSSASGASGVKSSSSVASSSAASVTKTTESSSASSSGSASSSAATSSSVTLNSA